MFYGYNPAYFLAFLSLAFYPLENVFIKLLREVQAGSGSWLSVVADGIAGSADLAWPLI